MQAFVPFDGSPKLAGAVIQAAYQEGLLVFGAGRDPMKVRMLLPVNTTDEELEAAFTILEKALQRVAEAEGVPC
jgi:4-aminobutyrate aminotransferase-like enzyme